MKYYVLVNPHGGLKKGRRLLEQVKPIFQRAGFELTIIDSTFAGHIRELAHQLDYTGYDGFIVIGGDGSMHEMVNGMLSRSDQKQMPIGLIPGGTGNSFLHDLNLLNPINAAEAIVNGFTRPIDVMEISINQIKRYAFNIVGWGLVTDVGKHAERYRWMGERRYTFTSVLEVLNLKPRPAQLVFGDNKIIDDFTMIIACNTCHTGKGMKMAPKSKLDDGLVDLVIIRYGATRLKLLTTLPKIFDGSHIYDPIVEYHQVKEFSLTPKVDETLNIDGELLGSTPIHVKVIQQKITVYDREKK
ncbi:MAG: diacylglycerol kinase family lipid kinase [Candidatus Marinimicrobia bacterium]|nr:diacylglycerol kinase family lipid kinase [Candidatus Neomarinimicrobiota bacterium]